MDCPLIKICAISSANICSLLSVAHFKDEWSRDKYCSQTFEDCRVIAKQAREYVEKLYSEKVRDEFTESLTPVFQVFQSNAHC